VQRSLITFSIIGALVAASAAHAQPGQDPRSRVRLFWAKDKRVEILSDRCPGGVANVEADRTLRRRMVGIAAREWEAFRFSTYDIASVGLPLVPTLDTAATRGRPRSIVPAAINPPLEGRALQRFLRIGRLEDEEQVTRRIGAYWAVVPDQSAIATQNKLWEAWSETGWAQPWSAAFISWVMCEAGLRDDAFARHAKHASYLDHIFANPAAAAFSPQPISTKPEPGDLLCAGRAKTHDIADLEEARTLAAAGALMHCDLVVGGSPERLYVIGGNVQNSVSLTVVPLRRGKVQPNEIRKWFGVFKLKAPSDPASAIDKVEFTCLGKADVEACLGAL
jgi:Uncharacterized protein conserved in bacteria (DUF2272)